MWTGGIGLEAPRVLNRASGGEKSRPVTPTALGPVHRAIGTRQERFAIAPIPGIDADTDAASDRQLMTINIMGLGQGP